MKASYQDAGARELERMQREKIAQNSHVFAKQWTELDKRTEKEVITDYMTVFSKLHQGVITTLLELRVKITKVKGH